MADVQKNPFSVHKNFCPQFWGQKWLRQLYGRLENAFFLQEKPHVHTIPRFRGGIWVFFLGGGGSADFIFMDARVFLRCGFPSFYSMFISTLGVDGARVCLWRFIFLALWVVVVVVDLDILSSQCRANFGPEGGHVRNAKCTIQLKFLARPLCRNVSGIFVV